MEYVSAFFKLIGLILIGVVGVAFVVFFGICFLAMLAAILGLFLIAWVFGVPITIKQNGVKIGYYRWFTFYPVKKW